MDIYLARTTPEIEVVNTDGIDLGRAPQTRRVWKPVALCWCSGGDPADLEKAKHFAEVHEPAHGWHVLVAPEDMPPAEHIEWAKAEAARLDAEKNVERDAAEAGGYDCASADQVVRAARAAKQAGSGK